MGDSQALDKTNRAKQILTHGGLVVVGISVFHHDETNVIFSYLTDGQTFLVWQFIEICKFILFPVILLYLIESFRRPVLRIRFFELILLGVIFYFLPPLVGFSIYFCGIHSIRHINYTWLKLRSKKYTIQTIIYLAITFTITSWLLGVLLFWQLPTADFADAALLKTVFIGLAALTVPHMLLVDGIFRQSD
jgi:Brp/Blh family beta-carotene 15,15'-monooxygenase